MVFFFLKKKSNAERERKRERDVFLSRSWSNNEQLEC